MRLIEAKNGAIDVSPDVLIAHINSIKAIWQVTKKLIMKK